MLQVRPITFRAACAFVAKLHRHHKAPRGHKFSLSAVDSTGKVVGVAIVGRPIARHDDNGLTAEVNRTCTDGSHNANSMLYGAAARACKAMGYHRIITFTQQGESGASPKAAGFVRIKDLPARKGWADSSVFMKHLRDPIGSGNVARIRWEIIFAGNRVYSIDNSPELWETRRPVQSAPQPKGSQMEQITISGIPFNAPLRYEEGHELSAGEATALNQMLHENLRNNFAQRVKNAVKNGGFDQSALQSEFDKYAEQYRFGARARGGPRVADPVLREARAISRMRIENFLKSQGKSLRNVTREALTAKIAEMVQRSDILELARQRVAESQAIAADDLANLTISEAAE